MKTCFYLWTLFCSLLLLDCWNYSVLITEALQPFVIPNETSKNLGSPSPHFKSISNQLELFSNTSYYRAHVVFTAHLLPPQFHLPVSHHAFTLLNQSWERSSVNDWVQTSFKFSSYSQALMMSNTSVVFCIIRVFCRILFNVVPQVYRPYFTYCVY